MRLPSIRTKKLQRKLRLLAAAYWQPAVYYGMLVIFFGLLLWFQLGSLTGGYSTEEAAASLASTDLGSIGEHPLNAPFAVITYAFGLFYTGDQALLPARAAATVVGLITLTTFYWLVRHWHDERTAILGTIIFGCSAWFLHTARFGTPDVLFFLLFTLVAGSVWLKKTDSWTVLFIGFGLAAALLYIPGMLWLLLAGAIWQSKTILRLAKEHAGRFAIGMAGMLALIAPLILAVYKSPELGRIVAGLPGDGSVNAVDALGRLAQIPFNLFVHGPSDPAIWLGRLPVLDAFSMAMLVFGVYLYARHRRMTRSKLVGAAVIVGAVLIALGGAVTLSVIMPFVYLLVAAGIGFMLDRWQKVFPRNVIAQSVGVGLISLAVIIVSWYGLRHYFVAWPNAPATKEVFVVK